MLWLHMLMTKKLNGWIYTMHMGGCDAGGYLPCGEKYHEMMYRNGGIHQQKTYWEVDWNWSPIWGQVKNLR